MVLYSVPVRRDETRRAETIHEGGGFNPDLTGRGPCDDPRASRFSLAATLIERHP
ncbi:hypothetical protein BDV95DRAFT_563065, partial [Massariosphaeria phaeospora]